MYRYKAAIIGCGRIGTFFDTPGSADILTHAKAYSVHPRVELKGVVDIDKKKSGRAAKIWHCNSYAGIEELFEAEGPEIISVCVPDHYHFEYLDKLIKFRPKAVIAEKPLTEDVAASKEIVSRYSKQKIPLFVNYSRRYDETVQKVKKMLDKGEVGHLLYAGATYTKGILHNGSHAIDIAHYLFGSVSSFKVLSGVIDYSDADPTVSAFLSYSGCPNFFLMACDERCYSIFEFDIVGSKKRILFDQFGLKYTEYSVRTDPVFEGYKDLKRERSLDTGLGKAMLHLIGNVVNHLEKGEDILCSGDDAVKTQIICDRLLKSYRRTFKHA